LSVRTVIRTFRRPWALTSLSIVLDIDNLDGTGPQLVRVISHQHRNQQQLSHNFVLHNDEGSMEYPFLSKRSSLSPAAKRPESNQPEATNDREQYNSPRAEQAPTVSQQLLSSWRKSWLSRGGSASARGLMACLREGGVRRLGIDVGIL
jgi:hypothetical protein